MKIVKDQMNFLIENSKYRKPLILKGIRQVGKNWILKEFGRRCYENIAYFNLIQRENDIFPIEVKSESNISTKSMKKFKESFPNQVKLRIRYSLNNLKLDNDVLNNPLFMADHTDCLIGIALDMIQKNDIK